MVSRHELHPNLGHIYTCSQCPGGYENTGVPTLPLLQVLTFVLCSGIIFATAKLVCQSIATLLARAKQTHLTFFNCLLQTQA